MNGFHLLADLSVGSVATGIGHSLRAGFYMLWDTLWALILGFTLSGAVQAFVSRDSMRRQLGDHRPWALIRASALGTASSSCSYAASAMARSLFAGGADFLASMVFMFASTNLVVELGVVLLVLIGWQFLIAEFVGGVIMIALLAVLGSLWLRGRALDQATSIARASSGTAGVGNEPAEGPVREPWKARIRTLAGWSDASGYTMSDLQMLRRELLIGFVVAGFLSTVVPLSFWSHLFLHGHGFWTSLENALIGPAVAIISFVCSIGNVPLAAALWQGGISFGGVVSFIFADLITLPLLMIYRKQYGGRMTLRMLSLFWLVMSATGLITEYLFKALRLVPSGHPKVVATDSLRLNYTSALDVAALVLFAVLYWLYHHREQLGAGGGYAKDPVCGMQVEAAHAPAILRHQGHTFYFCSDHCSERFSNSPDRYLTDASDDGQTSAGAVTDPICGMSVDPEKPGATRTIDGVDHYFCCEGCARTLGESQIESPGRSR